MHNERHACRRTDIVRMFFGIANALRTKGNLITYSIQKGGQL